MKKVHTYITVGCTLGIMLAAQIAGAGATLPEVDGFEGYALGQFTDTAPWDVGTNNGVRIQNTDVAELTKACTISNDYMRMDIEPGQGYTNVWCRLYTKPAPYFDTPDTAQLAGVACAFYVSSDGELYAAETNLWKQLLPAGSVPTGQWIAVAIHLDYQQQAYDLFIDTNGVFGAGMTNVNMSPLKFSGTAPTEMSNILLQTEAEGIVDGLSVTKAAVTDSAAGDEGELVMRELPGDMNLYMIAVPPGAYSGAGATMLGQLGLDLAQGLNVGAVCWVYNTSGSWEQWTLQADGTWLETVDGGGAGDQQLEQAQAVFLSQTGGQPATAFFANAQVSGPISQTLYGTDTGYGGWNPLGLQRTQAQTLGPNDFGFGSAGPGREIYVYDSSTHMYRHFWYDVSGGTWNSGQSAASYTMQPGQGFWYRRNATGNGTWNVPGQ